MLKKLITSLLFSYNALMLPAQTMDQPEIVPSKAIVSYTKIEIKEMDRAFVNSFLPSEILEFIVKQPGGSLYNLSLVCKKFCVILKPYCYSFENNEFESVLPHISSDIFALSWHINSCLTRAFPWQNSSPMITGLTRLTYLKITSQNYLEYDYELPQDSVSSLTNLRFLTAGKYMTDEGIKPLTNLTFLDIGGSDHSVVTGEGIMGLTNLTYLNASCVNGITKEGFQHLTNLTHLNLSNVGEYSIYGSQFIHNFDLSPLTKLRSLDLCNTCCLFNDHLKFLTNLTSLYIFDAFAYDRSRDGLISHCGKKNNRTNKQFDIDAILSLPNLTELICNYELIHYGFEKLTKLKALCLAHRERVFVGDITLEDIGCLTSLEELTIEEYEPTKRWERNTYPIIFDLWAGHNLTYFSGCKLPEKTFTNGLKFLTMKEMEFVRKGRWRFEEKETYGQITYKSYITEELVKGLMTVSFCVFMFYATVYQFIVNYFYCGGDNPCCSTLCTILYWIVAYLR